MSTKKNLIASFAAMALVISFFVFNSLKGYLGSADHMDKVYLTHSFLYLMFFFLAFVAVLNWPQFASAIKRYFSASSHPLNLAVFRIIIFSGLLDKAIKSKAVFFSGLPKELLYPPPGLENIIQYIPMNPHIAGFAGWVLAVSALMAAFGLFTRVSACIALVSAIYFLGIPQVFGKINHYHFLVWFGVILAVSPCADILSVDAVIRNYRNAKRGTYVRPASSIEYGLPIRLIFILFGVLYFFPGFWKIYICGYEWFASDNLIHLMYNKWYELDGWLPFFRIDRHPFVCNVGAFMTIVFEMSFIFLIFFDGWRWLAVFNGLFFHNMTGLFMSITFINLQKCYVIFFDWHRIFHRIGTKFFRRSVRAVFGSETLGSKMISLLTACDLFGHTEYCGKQAKDVLAHHNMPEGTLYVLTEDAVLTGPRAWHVLCARNPVLWVLLPYFWVLSLGPDRREDQSKSALEHVVKHVPSLVKYVPNPYRRGTRFATWIASLFIFVNIYCGFGAPGGISSWPFSAFPHFAVILEHPVKTWTEFIFLDEQREIISFDQKKLVQDFGSTRYWGLMYAIMGERNAETMSRKLSSLIRVAVRSEPAVRSARHLQVRQSIFSTRPEDKGQEALRSRTLAEIPITLHGPGSPGQYIY